MRIQISQIVRLTLSGAELQILRPGELYDLPPAIARVLVSDGFAIEVVSAKRLLWEPVPAVDHIPDRRRTAS